jgi:hypothetical protein
MKPASQYIKNVIAPTKVLPPSFCFPQAACHSVEMDNLGLLRKEA